MKLRLIILLLLFAHSACVKPDHSFSFPLVVEVLDIDDAAVEGATVFLVYLCERNNAIERQSKSRIHIEKGLTDKEGKLVFQPLASGQLDDANCASPAERAVVAVKSGYCPNTSYYENCKERATSSMAAAYGTFEQQAEALYHLEYRVAAVVNLEEGQNSSVLRLRKVPTSLVR
jgi:hypothetical protein